MLRMTEAAFSKLRKPRKSTSGLANAHLRLKEEDVVKACVGLMRAHGWRAIRLQSGVMRGISGGHPVRLNPNGTPDWLFLKGAASSQWVGHSIAWFCEFKAEGCRPSRDQLDYMAELRNSGLVAEWFDNLRAFSDFVRITFGVR